MLLNMDIYSNVSAYKNIYLDVRLATIVNDAGAQLNGRVTETIRLDLRMSLLSISKYTNSITESEVNRTPIDEVVIGQHQKRTIGQWQAN